MKLVSLLSGNGFVLYNKDIARSLSVNSAIIFGQICASYESFEKKGMLTIHKGKEYFFLTSETLEEETALSYKLQLKATKELEEAGYIETKVMGVPSKKYFHITDKIVKELLKDDSSSSDQKEDLNIENDDPEQDSDDLSYSHGENLGITNETGKPLPTVSTIKNKNEKGKSKNKNNNLVNKNVNKKQQIIDKLVYEYMNKGLSKDLCFRVVNDALEAQSIQNFGGYLRTALDTTLENYEKMIGIRDKHERWKEATKNIPGCYNWLEPIQE